MSRVDFVGMKVLTIKQPFATLLAHGVKVCELRNWNTRYRGHFLIHASAAPHKLMKEAREQYGHFRYLTGMVIGMARLAGVATIEQVESGEAVGHLTELDKLAGPFKYAWQIADARLIDPFPAKGALNWWTLKGDADADNETQ